MVKRFRDTSPASEDDDTLEAGSLPTSKYASLEPEDRTVTPSAMRCLLPPHKPLSFATYAEYETHYNQAHTNRCHECKKNLPTSHFLDLHIAEAHDPLVAAKRDKGEKTYACFVEGCDKVCLEWKKRRSHLVDKHGYPKNYDFFIVNNGVDGRRSMLRPGIDAQGHRESSRDRSGSSATGETHTAEATSASLPVESEVAGEAVAQEGAAAGTVRAMADAKAAGVIDELTTSISALKMVPRSITFGKRKGRAGLAKT